MKQQEKFYDVYVSYPPSVDKERINACLYDNLPQNEAEDLIQALRERPQAIIAENCTQDERENAQHYFNYLGLDVIVRQSLELTPNIIEKDVAAPTAAAIQQCPVCMTIVDAPDTPDCPICALHFASATEQTIEHKRIEWQEKLAFEHKKQAEIAHNLQLEKERNEKRLRKQIRAELEEKLREEMGANYDINAIAVRKKNFLIGVGAAFAIFILLAIGYMSAKYL